MTQKNPDNAVQSIERALSIIELLCQHSRGLGVTEIGQKLGLHKSTVHRLLGTLLSKGYAEQNPETERYRASIKLAELGLFILDSLEFRKEAIPFLKELVEVSRETVQLSVLDQGEMVVVERDSYPEPIVVKMGLRSKVHCSAAGKVLLAHLTREQAVSILKEQGMEQYTVNTITDLEFMLAFLNKIKIQGYAINDEEQVEGMRAIAAPVFNHQGKAVAAVSIAGPTSRLTLERIGRLVTVLKETCESISYRLGYKYQKSFVEDNDDFI
jgi:DNA-binding IclR family transcriptional regulator